ncbi:hypothetical protein [Mycobacterium phage WXIN]|nr:hypothetical protein [Mycobacterium phage WXIN]
MVMQPHLVRVHDAGEVTIRCPRRQGMCPTEAHDTIIRHVARYQPGDYRARLESVHVAIERIELS